MMESTVNINFDGMDAFKAQAKGYRARVGVIGDKAARKDGNSDMNNAEIAVLQIFGSVSAHIPPRDFLYTPIKTHTPDIAKALSSQQAKACFARGDIKGVFKIMGVAGEAIVQKAFETAGFGQWLPNAQRTIDMKGSAQPLIDSGELRKAVTSDVTKGAKK